jgi:cytoskeletal protein RodZ
MSKAKVVLFMRHIKKHKNMSENLSRNLRYIAWAVLVLVVIGFIAIWVVFHQASAVKQANQLHANPVAAVPTSQLPAMFPPNVPLEPGATVTSNYNSAGANGQLQATRSFRSAKSADQNFAIYQDFLTGKASGWTIVSTTNDPQTGDRSFLAKGDGGSLTITIIAVPSQPLPASLVSITYATNPVSAPAAIAPSPTGQK